MPFFIANDCLPMSTKTDHVLKIIHYLTTSHSLLPNHHQRLHIIVTDWMFNSKYMTPFILNFQTMPFLLQTTACLCRQRQIRFWNLLAVDYSYRVRAILWMTADKWQILQYGWPAISFVNSKTVWCNGQCTQFIERSGFDSACCYVRFDQKHFIIFFNFLI